MKSTLIRLAVGVLALNCSGVLSAQNQVKVEIKADAAKPAEKPAEKVVDRKAELDPEAKASNQKTANAIAKALRAARLNGYKIEVEYKNGTATLIGEVPNDARRERALEATRQVPGVKEVVNKLTITARKPAQAKVEAAPAEEAPAEEEAVAVDVVEAGGDGQVQQYEQMMRPRMWRELEFIRQNCELTPDQRPQIKAAAEASVKQAAKDFVKGRRQGGQATVGTAIRNDLIKTLEKTLTPEQMTHYREVAARRTASIKSTTIRTTVAKLDNFLYLSREQRDKVSASLTENWKEDWEQWLMLWRYGGMYFPTVPDKELVPHLNAQQKQVWKGAQKINASFWGGEQQQDDEDKWWTGKEDDQPKAKSGEADSKPAGKGDK